jgi:predicted DNA-binding protein
MSPPREPRPRQRRYSLRRQARLDTETYAKLEELACTFHRKHAVILRFVMGWGLLHSTAWTIDRSNVAVVSPVPVVLEPELLQQVKEAAAAHGVSVAAWLREAMRRVTADDFPASWRAGEIADQLHESGSFHQKFGMRLDEVTSRKLEALTQTFHRPAADMIRQLIAQATPEDFPPSWHLAVAERQRRAVQPVGRAR